MPAVRITNGSPTAMTRNGAAPWAISERLSAVRNLPGDHPVNTAISTIRAMNVHDSLAVKVRLSRCPSPDGAVAAPRGGGCGPGGYPRGCRPRRRGWSRSCRAPSVAAGPVAVGGGVAVVVLGAERAGHGPDQLLHVGVGGPESGHPAAHPEHLHAVGHGQHLGHVVADQGDGGG